MREQNQQEQDDGAVAAFMREAAALPAPVRVPEPAVVWCRGQLMSSPLARRRMLRWLAIFEGAEVAACLAAAVALFYLSWTTVTRLPAG